MEKGGGGKEKVNTAENTKDKG